RLGLQATTRFERGPLRNCGYKSCTKSCTSSASSPSSACWASSAAGSEARKADEAPKAGRKRRGSHVEEFGTRVVLRGVDRRLRPGPRASACSGRLHHEG